MRELAEAFIIVTGIGGGTALAINQMPGAAGLFFFAALLVVLDDSIVEVQND